MEPNKITDKNLSSIQSLSLNPFFLSIVLQHFLSGYEKKQPEFHLLYLVLPIIFYKPTRDFLIHANSKSTIFGMFLDDVESRTLLGGIQDRYLYFKELTSEAIIIASNEGKLSIDKTPLLLKKVDYKKVKDPDTRYFFRAAHYLGLLFSKTHYADIYRKLGVRTL